MALFLLESDILWLCRDKFTRKSMIVSFSVSNFRSFYSEETFSLVASNRLSGSHDAHTVPIPDSKERVLRTAVLYGANGAGKSNLFKALRYLRSVALRPRKRNSGTGREAFRFGGESNTPSCFDLQFIASDKLYRFGFKADDQRIIEEWLVQVIGGRERIVYERITDTNGQVTIDAPGFKGGREKLVALATVGSPQNQSFLATIHTTLDDLNYGEELGSVLDWFNNSLNLIAPDTSYIPLGELLARDEDFLKFAGDFLNASSTGVDHLNVRKEEITEEDLYSFLPKEVVTKVLEDIRENADKPGVALVQLSQGNELLIERTSENSYFRITIQTSHKKKDGTIVQLELSEESDGTRRLLELIPALNHVRTGNAIYFIDEVDRSMHPMLIRKFLEFFLKSCEGGQRQVIVTTHESSLLDLELLRRDEIWFAEKDLDSATRLHSLVDFKVRKDLEIHKHYLQGRFGAVPFLGNIDRLLAEKS
jgi:uncharacterized protein